MVLNISALIEWHVVHQKPLYLLWVCAAFGHCEQGRAHRSSVLRASRAVSTAWPQARTHSSVQRHGDGTTSKKSTLTPWPLRSVKEIAADAKGEREAGSTHVLCPQLRESNNFHLKVLFPVPNGFDGFKPYCLTFSWLDICCTCTSTF